jgi:hypothetical protein
VTTPGIVSHKLEMGSRLGSIPPVGIIEPSWFAGATTCGAETLHDANQSPGFGPSCPVCALPSAACRPLPLPAAPPSLPDCAPERPSSCPCCDLSTRLHWSARSVRS